MGVDEDNDITFDELADMVRQGYITFARNSLGEVVIVPHDEPVTPDDYTDEEIISLLGLSAT